MLENKFACDHNTANCYNIVWSEMKDTDKWQCYNHFRPFFCHMYVHLPQNWGSDGKFEVLHCSKFWLVQKLWHKTQIFPFPFCTKSSTCIFCVLCHNFCTKYDLGLSSTSKWPSESLFCERLRCSWQKMASFGQYMAIYQLLFFGSLPNLHRIHLRP